MRAAFLWVAMAITAARAQITWDRLVNAQREPQNWLAYPGTNLGQRYSTLSQITPENVKNLQLKWVFRAPSSEKFQATPLAAGGILYTVQPPNGIVAIGAGDAGTGHFLWIDNHKPANTARLCCGRVNRGLAILGDALYIGTIDARLIAVNARSGKPEWNVPIARSESG